MRSAQIGVRPYRRRRRPPNAQRLPTIGGWILLAALLAFVVGPVLAIALCSGAL